MEEPERTLGFLLHDVARLLRKRFEQNARHLELTRSQWQVLVYLSQNEGIQQGALAELLEIEPITLVRILDRLQAADMIERRRHERDRRVWLLHLRSKARPLLEEIRRIGTITKAEALDGVAANERERLIQILTTMKANLIEATNKPIAEHSVTHA